MSSSAWAWVVRSSASRGVAHPGSPGTLPVPRRSRRRTVVPRPIGSATAEAPRRGCGSIGPATPTGRGRSGAARRDEAASLTDPLWVGDSLVFTSDRAATFPDDADEQANLWIWDGLATAAGDRLGEPRRLTHQTEADGYVRDATTDGRRIVWHSRGEIKVLDSPDGPVRTLDVTLPGHAGAAALAHSRFRGRCHRP